jgi:hypothetical protein
MKTSELTGAALDWAVAKCEGLLHDDGTASDYWQPSELWEQGGPIIDHHIDQLTRARINLTTVEWEAVAQGNDQCTATGPTSLIAAMRCYVASKLGDEIEIPKELL